MKSQSLLGTFGPVLLAAVLAGLAGPALATNIPPGVDLYRIVNSPRSYLDFSTEPLLAGTFGANASVPTGLIPISCVGPTAAIRRLETANFANGVDTVASELVWLKFRTASPLLMTVNGVQSQYNLDCIIRPSPVYKGQMTLTENSSGSTVPRGGKILPGPGPAGTYFDIRYSLTPIIMGATDATQPTIYPPPIFYDRISLTDSVVWSHTPPNNTFAPTVYKNFYPGVDPANPGAPLERLVFQGKYLHLELELMPSTPWILADANGDSRVTDADYTLWANNYNSPYAEPGVGDWNWDFEVTDADYTLWADSYGQSSTSLPVPEPASLSLLALGALALARRRTN